MKKNILTLLFALVCSGGLFSLQAQTSLVQVIHNAADPAASVVDIYIQYHGTEIKLDDVAFRTATGYLELPSGTPINIIISPSNSQNAHQVIKAFHGITLENGQSYQVIANGVVTHDFAGNPEHKDIAFDLFISANARTSSSNADNVDLRVFHGSTDAPRVGVNANGNTIIPGFSYGDFTEYLSIPADVYELEVTPAGAPESALFTYTADLSGLGGGSAIVLASGFLNPAANQNGAAFTLIAVLSDGTVIELPIKATARAQIIHNSADPAAEVVDVYVRTPSDTLKVEDFTFRTATPFIDLPAGVALEIVIAGANSESISDGIATFNASLKAGEAYYIVASGVLSPDDFSENPLGQDTGFTLLIKEGARESAIAGFNVDVQILHGSTDAPGVGIKFDDRVIIPNIGYQHFVRDYIIFASRPYEVDITLGNQPNEELFSFEADFSELNGAAGIVIASGFVDPSSNQEGAAFTLLFVLPDGTVVELPQIGQEPETASVQVIHNAADPAAEIVDIYVDTGEDTIKIDDFAFRSATPFLDLPAETELNIVVAGGNSESIADGLASFPVTLVADESYYVVANGVLDPSSFAPNPDEISTGFTLLIEAGAREAAESGNGVDLKVLHGSSDAPNVGVNANGNTIIPGFSYTEFAGYLNVPATSYVLDITLGGMPESIVASFEADITGLDGGAAIVIASGFLTPEANQSGAAFGLIAVLPDGTVIELPAIIDEPQFARVQVIHNAADPAAEIVDIYVDTGEDTIKVDDFTFRSATPFLDLPAETELNIVVAGGNSNSIQEGIASFPVTLAADESYYVVANGVLNPDTFAVNPEGIETAFTLSVFPGAREMSESGEGVDLNVLHGATDAPGVGVNANGDVIISALQYTEFSGYLNVPASEYQLDITLANEPESIVASFDADITGLEGGSALIVASGFLDPTANMDGPSFALLAVLPDGTVILLPVAIEEPPTARVQVIHNAADPAAEVVDIYVDLGTDTIKIDDFAFRTATPFLDLPAETEIIIVVAAGNSESIEDGLASFPVVLEDEESYYVVANGVLSPDEFAPNPDEVSTAFTLLVEAGARESAESGTGVDLKVLHGATDAPNVGVNANGDVIIPGFSYTDFAGYLNVPASEYQLDITLGGEPETVVASFDADINGLDGGAAIVIASGFLAPSDNQDGTAFGLIAVLADGTVIELPVTVPSARVQVIHNAADPAAEVVDIYVDLGTDTIKIEDFAFRTATPFLELPAEVEITIVIAGGNSESITEGLASFPVTLVDDESYYVVANGVLSPDEFAPNPDEVSTAFTLLVEAGARESAESGTGVDLKVLHGATDAPNVGVNANGATIIPGFSYTDFAGYLNVPAESYQLDITPGGDSLTVLLSYNADISGLEGGAAFIAASGFLDTTMNPGGEAFGLIAVLPDGTVLLLPEAGTAGIQMIHNAADPVAAVVDVYINTGDEVQKIDNLNFQSATPFLDLPADKVLTITVAGENSTSEAEGIRSFDLTLASGQNYYVVANGLLNTTSFAANPLGHDTEFDLYVKDGAIRMSSGNNFKMTAFHGITDAPDIDVLAELNTTPLFSNLSYGTFSERRSLSIQDYNLFITPANDNNNVVSSFNANLRSMEGESGLLIASGFMNPSENQNGRLMNTMMVLQDGSTTMLNNAPTSNDNLLQKDELLTVYPNPASGITTVAYEVEVPGSVTFDILDAMGRNVYRQVFESRGTGQYNWSLNVDQLKSGVHTIRMQTSSTRSIFKMVVLK